MTIREITQYLETIAPRGLQESYDNSGLIVGSNTQKVSKVLVSLDCVERTVEEAKAKGCELIIAHHPIIFGGLKRITDQTYIERTIALAIKNEIAIYAIHTNLDNVLNRGVNSKIADRLGLQETRILRPKQDQLLKLITFVPEAHTDRILDAVFKSGAGSIGAYEECSFRVRGSGTFKAGEGTDPYVGNKGERHEEHEDRVEVILPIANKKAVIQALKEAHPYEEVAYDLYALENQNPLVGSGLVGILPQAMPFRDFLAYLKEKMDLDCIRYTAGEGPVHQVALCGGSGSFLLEDAKSIGADVFITGDFKYHQFFDADNQISICDIGHYESEKYTIDLIHELLTEKFTTFAVLKTEGDTNPVNYFY